VKFAKSVQQAHQNTSKMHDQAVNEDVAEDDEYVNAPVDSESPTKLTHMLDNIKVQTEEA